MKRLALAAALAGAALACRGGPPPPAPLDTKTELCASCRMPVSDARLAAQIVRRGEEARFFDDLGCLARALAAAPADSPDAAVYVADHRTGGWIPRERAVFTRAPGFDTPMGSHVLAHADSASRDADPAARGGEPVRFEDIVRAERGALPPPATGRRP